MCAGAWYVFRTSKPHSERLCVEIEELCQGLPNLEEERWSEHPEEGPRHPLHQRLLRRPALGLQRRAALRQAAQVRAGHVTSILVSDWWR